VARFQLQWRPARIATYGVEQAFGCSFFRIRADLRVKSFDLRLSRPEVGEGHGARLDGHGPEGRRGGEQEAKHTETENWSRRPCVQKVRFYCRFDSAIQGLRHSL